jgi:acyl transferase domain-containing protein
VNGNGKVYTESNGSNVSRKADEPSLLLFSAYSGTSVETQIDAFREFAKSSTAKVRDLAYTLANRREQKPQRAYAVVNDVCDVQASVTQVIQPTVTPRVAWVFTGQGAQWPEMGAELIANNATFRATVQKLDKFLLSLPTPPPWTVEGM